MHKFDFSRDAVSPRFRVGTTFVTDSAAGLIDIRVRPPHVPLCEFCRARPQTHWARVIVQDARQGDLVQSTFGVCPDCWADARREGTLIASVEL